MNPVFVALVLMGALLLWLLLSFAYRIVGGIAEKVVGGAKKAMGEEETGAEAFVRGFKGSLSRHSGTDDQAEGAADTGHAGVKKQSAS